MPVEHVINWCGILKFCSILAVYFLDTKGNSHGPIVTGSLVEDKVYGNTESKLERFRGFTNALKSFDYLPTLNTSHLTYLQNLGS